MYKFSLVHFISCFFKFYQMPNYFKIKWFYSMFLTVVVISTWYDVVDTKELHLRIKEYIWGKTAWTRQVLTIIDKTDRLFQQQGNSGFINNEACVFRMSRTGFRGHGGSKCLTCLRCFSDVCMSRPSDGCEKRKILIGRFINFFSIIDLGFFDLSLHFGLP